MQNIIVAFAKLEDAANFKKVIIRGGMDVNVVCTSGAQALSAMEDLGNGVIVCGFRLSDMQYTELAESLPGFFQMLLIASPNKVDGDSLPDNVVYLPTPIQRNDLYQTLQIMLEGIVRRRKKAKSAAKQRNEKDKEIITKAKELLMERHHMTEPEAHKYLQKCSMDSGTDMLETAEMVISLNV
ncbi:MAG: ANTAR domain-containing protein [Butyrivibrio sp.]|nr:ANTAR domain-containing protein [Butyrivibrio sp.]